MAWCQHGTSPSASILLTCAKHQYPGWAPHTSPWVTMQISPHHRHSSEAVSAINIMWITLWEHTTMSTATNSIGWEKTTQVNIVNSSKMKGLPPWYLYWWDITSIGTINNAHFLWWSNHESPICPQGRVENQLTNKAILSKIIIWKVS